MPRTDVFGQSAQTVDVKGRLLVLSHREEMKDWLVADSFIYLLYFDFVWFCLCYCP